MKSTQKILLGIAAIVAIFSFGILTPGVSRIASLSDILPRLTQKPVAVTQEDIPNLTRLAVVRIINHVTGNITVPSFIIDWKNLVLYLNVGTPTTSTVDLKLSGSGFIVNPNGYILTNSHVISTAVVKQTYVNAILGEYAISYALQQATTLSKADQAAIAKNQDQIKPFLQSAANYLLEKSSAALTSNITVLNPASTHTDTLDNLISDSFPATIVSVNDNFFIDGKDVGIIKINQQNLPAISLGDSGSLSVGQPIYAVGFPGSADIDLASFAQSTIAPGSINAIKPSDTGDFQLIQTDAKVSEGSSGGPLLDNQGRAIGLTTLSSDPSAQIGDTFAFGVPIALAQSVLAQNAVPYNTTDTYYNHVLNGIALLQNNRCKQAIAEFQLAQQTNQDFPSPPGLSGYISQCQTAIANGNSIDTRWDEMVAWAKTSGSGAWWLVGVLALIVAGIFILVIRRFLMVIKREEADISRLEMNQNVNTSNLPSQTLADYVKSARSKGIKDEDIVSELGKAGWQAGDIASALEAASKQ